MSNIVNPDDLEKVITDSGLSGRSAKKLRDANVVPPPAAPRGVGAADGHVRTVSSDL